MGTSLHGEVWGCYCLEAHPSMKDLVEDLALRIWPTFRLNDTYGFYQVGKSNIETVAFTVCAWYVQIFIAFAFPTAPGSRNNTP